MSPLIEVRKSLLHFARGRRDFKKSDVARRTSTLRCGLSPGGDLSA
jgi:hypothetical protein